MYKLTDTFVLIKCFFAVLERRLIQLLIKWLQFFINIMWITLIIEHLTIPQRHHYFRLES